MENMKILLLVDIAGFMYYKNMALEIIREILYK